MRDEEQFRNQAKCSAFARGGTCDDWESRILLTFKKDHFMLRSSPQPTNDLLYGI